MTGFDTKWEKHREVAEKQNIVMVVHFRPDKLPKDKAEWYKWLGNYARTTSRLIEKGVIDENKKTAEFNL